MATRKGYGQFCPVAKASEIVAERWTPLVLRELICGSKRFNDLRRGLPHMSPALLSQRLKELEFAQVIRRRSGAGRTVEYSLTEAGRDLRPIIEALGCWGARWASSSLTAEDYDPSLLMWDIRRNIDATELPGTRRTVVEFHFPDAKPASRRWWLVADAGAPVDLCLKDPGFEVDLLLTADLKSMVEIWLGQLAFDDAIRARRLTLEGARALAATFQRCMKLSLFAHAAQPPRPHAKPPQAVQ